MRGHFQGSAVRSPVASRVCQPAIFEMHAAGRCSFYRPLVNHTACGIPSSFMQSNALPSTVHSNAHTNLSPFWQFFLRPAETKNINCSSATRSLQPDYPMRLQVTFCFRCAWMIIWFMPSFHNNIRLCKPPAAAVFTCTPSIHPG